MSLSDMKRCLKCDTQKPLAEFYLKDKATGRISGKCKTCHKADVVAHRATKIEYYRQIDKTRAMRPHRVAARQKWASKYPERDNARSIVEGALKRGQLHRLPCLICGEKAEGHHPDYSAPLDVVWLCRAHHKQAHAMARRAP